MTTAAIREQLRRNRQTIARINAKPAAELRLWAETLLDIEDETDQLELLLRLRAVERLNPVVDLEAYTYGWSTRKHLAAYGEVGAR